jgi:hypothetical protein
MLLYQIGVRDARMLVDFRSPLPADLKAYIRVHVIP